MAFYDNSTGREQFDRYDGSDVSDYLNGSWENVTWCEDPDITYNVDNEKFIILKERMGKYIIKKKAYYSGDVGSSIVNPTTGFYYPAHKVGSADERLFFKVRDSRGKLGTNGNPRTYFFESPEDSYQLFKTTISDENYRRWKTTREKIKGSIIHPVYQESELVNNA